MGDSYDGKIRHAIEVVESVELKYDLTIEEIKNTLMTSKFIFH